MSLMKVLFICRANVGRSQAAMEFYNQLAPGQGASAGTIVDAPGETLKERPGAIPIIIVMREYSMDMSDNTRTQLTETMLDDYEKLVVMAEPETVPEWLANNPKTVIWNIEDPKGQSLEKTREIATQIKARVEELAQNPS